MGILPDEIKPAMQGVFPSHVVTCSGDGIPNASSISQVYYVDADHVALSHQFFNKTTRNVRENPRALVWVVNPETFETWASRSMWARWLPVSTSAGSKRTRRIPSCGGSKPRRRSGQQASRPRRSVVC